MLAVALGEGSDGLCSDDDSCDDSDDGYDADECAELAAVVGSQLGPAWTDVVQALVAGQQPPAIPGQAVSREQTRIRRAASTEARGAWAWRRRLAHSETADATDADAVSAIVAGGRSDAVAVLRWTRQRAERAADRWPLWRTAVWAHLSLCSLGR